MKTLLLSFTLLFTLGLSAQITTPVIRAGFGVDADLRANYFNNFVQSGNDDWFNNGTPGLGQFVIDTLGAAKMMQRFATDAAFRRLPFYRTMRVPQFSLVNNRLWIDAVYIRDYNGQAGGDSTAFVSSNKNGDSPGIWNGGVTSVLDKNDISDMMIHVRRQGASKTDSLWFMGGISLQGTSGNRYFDFELYQTDIFYSRTTGQFYNYGPDAGHTSWQLDASGNIIVPGDVIFTAEYSSSSLTFIEARIWVDRATMNITPTDFDWVGGFEGASTSSQFGYANIRPKQAGTYYTGMQSTNGTWAGPFGFIDGGNNLLTTYTARQYMEFSVNLTKLGLDPITLLGGSACGLPFRRILVKTRTSTSFSSELKDFIGPFDFFQAPPVQAYADVPLYCGVIGSSELSVINPASASVYTWSTLDGHIVSDSVNHTITVDMPGTYVVTQQLLDGCASFARDTVVITYDATCIPMNDKITSFRGNMQNRRSQLSWKTSANHETAYFDVQRSANGTDFETVGRVDADATLGTMATYQFTDDLGPSHAGLVYYRLRARMDMGSVAYSGIISLQAEAAPGEVAVYPNPVKNVLQLSIPAQKRGEATIQLYNMSGSLVKVARQSLNTGGNQVQMNVAALQPGTYMAQVAWEGKTEWKKIMISSTILNK